jgi:hypothetical protein
MQNLIPGDSQIRSAGSACGRPLARLCAGPGPVGSSPHAPPRREHRIRANAARLLRCRMCRRLYWRHTRLGRLRHHHHLPVNRGGIASAAAEWRRATAMASARVMAGRLVLEGLPNRRRLSRASSVSAVVHIHLPPWHQTCSNLPKLNTVVPWIAGHCFTRFQYPMADFQ